MTKLLSTLALVSLALGVFFALPSCASDAPAPGQAQMWEQNCNRCHNFRDPGSLSDDEWEVAVMHMRVRADLTAKEAEAIEQFLKAGN